MSLKVNEKKGSMKRSVCESVILNIYHIVSHLMKRKEKKKKSVRERCESGERGSR